MASKKLSFNLLMLKLQKTFPQERKLQRIQESWKIPSFLKPGTIGGDAQEAPGAAGHLETGGSSSCYRSWRKDWKDYPGNDDWSPCTSQGGPEN